MNVSARNRGRRVLLGQHNNNLVNLIVMNAIIFVVLKFIYVIYLVSKLEGVAYQENMLNWFILPADFGKFLTRPWTLLTSSVTHINFWVLLSNMLWLWAFGYILQEMVGNKKLIPLYIYGAVAGGVMYLFAFNIIPKLQPVLATAGFYGASPGVMAIAIATTTIAPDYRIFPMINGGIPLWIITLLYAAISLTTLSSGDPGIIISNIGGAAIGYIFIYRMRRGSDWSNWMNRFFDWAGSLFNPDRERKKRSVKNELFYKSTGKEPYKKIPNITQQKIDDILDKINQKGYRFLTDEEKEILRRASEADDQ
jgi:membrane associated rhomboid family serine protease